MSIDRIRLRVILTALCLVRVSTAPAQEPEGWSADFSFERASVTIDGADQTWGSERIQFLYRDLDRGGVFFGGARLTRFGESDAAFVAGGYRRLGDWTVFGQLGSSPNADFYYRQSAEAEVSRRAVGALVAHLNYRFLNFPTAKVQIFAPGATYYFAKGEVHARVSFVNNRGIDVNSQSFLARSQYWVSERVRISGGVAIGERIFDITSLPGVPAEGWVVYSETLVRIHDNGGLGVSIGFAHEEPSFDRRNFGVYYRRWF